MGWGPDELPGGGEEGGPGWSALVSWQRSIGQITNKQRTRRKDRGNGQPSGFWPMSEEGGFD